MDKELDVKKEEKKVRDIVDNLKAVKYLDDNNLTFINEKKIAIKVLKLEKKHEGLSKCGVSTLNDAIKILKYIN